VSVVKEFVDALDEYHDRVDADNSIKLLYESFKYKRIAHVDIEVEKLSEYASVDDATNPVTLISYNDTLKKKIYAFTFRKDFAKFFHFIHPVYHEPTKTEYKIHVFMFNDEREMLTAYAKFFHRVLPDIQTGWSYEDFDIPYLYNRYDVLGLKAEKCLLSADGYVKTRKVLSEPGKMDFARHKYINTSSGVVIFDMLWGYRRLYGKHPEGNGLNQTSLRHLGFGKLSTSIGDEKWYYEKFDEKTKSGDFLKFIEYGFVDVLLPELLEKKLSILLAFHFIASFFGVEWEKLHQATVILDTSFMYFKEPEMWLPSKHKTIDEFTLEGGSVITPRAGFHLGLMLVFDFSRQYPNAIRGANLGIDTYIPPYMHSKYEEKDVVRLTNGEWFVKDKISFVSRMVTTLFKFRDVIESIRDKYDPSSELYDVWTTIRQRVKEIINAVYGMMTNVHTRQFHAPSATSITYLGRDMFQHNQKYLKNLSVYFFNKGLNIRGRHLKIRVLVAYGDTDSSMVWTDLDDVDDAVYLGRYIEKYLNKSYVEFCSKHNMFPNYTRIEFESIFKNVFFPLAKNKKSDNANEGAKKNYATYMLWTSGKRIVKMDTNGKPLLTPDGKQIPSQKFVWKGIGGKKSNSPKVSKDLQENLLKMACDGKKKDEILPFLRSVVQRTRNCATRQVCPQCRGTAFHERDDSGKILGAWNFNKILDDSASIRCDGCGGVFHVKDLEYNISKLVEIGIPHNFGREFSNYKTKEGAKNFAALRAAKYARDVVKARVSSSDTILYFYVSSVSKYPSTDVMAINAENPFFPRQFTIDVEKMLKKVVLAKIDSIIPFLDIKWNEITENMTRKRMD